MTKPSYDEYFMGFAEHAKIRSSCVRSKVGAVIAKDNRLRGSGYNDSPPGMPGCEACPRRLSDVEPGSSYDTGAGACVACHAEANALLDANRADLIGATLYITRPPCDGCLKLIQASGVARIVYPGSEGTTNDLPQQPQPSPGRPDRANPVEFYVHDLDQLLRHRK